MPKTTVAFLFVAGFLATCMFWAPAEARAAEPAPAEPPSPTIEELMAKLSSRDDAELYQAIQDLGLRGPEAAPAAKDLLKIFTSDKTSKNVRYETALALGRIGPAAKDAVPALIEALRSEDVTLRGYAAGALGGIGPDAAAATKALAVALRDPSRAVRGNAAKSLGCLKTEDGEAVAALENLRTNENDKAVRADCEAALRALKDAKDAKQQANP